MTRRTFAAALARYGTDLAAWPATAREAALTRLARSDAARAAFARALDAEASRSPCETTDLALGERLLIPLRHTLPSALPAKRPTPQVRHPAMLGWSAVAAAVALGLWLGGGGVGAAPGPSPDLFASAQLAPLAADQP